MNNQFDINKIVIVKKMGQSPLTRKIITATKNQQTVLRKPGQKMKRGYQEICNTKIKESGETEFH